MAINFASGLSGAASGASLGSMAGPWGAAAGGVLGGVAGLFGGGKKKKKKYSTFDPKQKALYDQYIQGIQGQGPMAGQYNYDANQANDVFDQNVARPENRNFQENIVPEITGSFRQNNIGNSSYTGEALSRAGRNVQEKLSGLRADMQFRGQESANDRKQNAIQNALGMATFQYGKSQPSGIDQILAQTAPSAGKWLEGFMN